jgi:hypothetical protein
MSRAGRLRAAPRWLAASGESGKIAGRGVVRAYAKWFGVDLSCALVELRLLGMEIDARYAERLLTTLRDRAQPRKFREPPPGNEPGGGVDWDDEFAYIAGFTRGGAPFGVTWDGADWLDPDDGDG